MTVGPPALGRVESLVGSRPSLSFDREFQKDLLKLLPGEYSASNQDLILSTVLGSCVAACLYDPIAKVGGMNHFLLPGRDDGDWGGRYGVHAMELLVNELLKRGAQRQRLVAKVFGAARVLKNMSHMDVGADNAKFIEEYLRAEGFSLQGSDLRGNKARRVLFFTRTGQALVRHVSGSDDSSIREEERYVSQASRISRAGGDIELF